jgi:hypothetical protein
VTPRADLDIRPTLADDGARAVPRPLSPTRLLAG